jgi:hypothetical protein
MLWIKNIPLHLVRNLDFRTPLHLACCYNQLAIVKFLVEECFEQWANLNGGNGTENNISNNNDLLNNGANNQSNTLFNANPNSDTGHANPDIIAGINAIDRWGMRPVDDAKKYQFQAIVEYLEGKGSTASA